MLRGFDGFCSEPSPVGPPSRKPANGYFPANPLNPNLKATMKLILRDMIETAARKAHESGALPSGEFPPVELDAPKAEAHGDLATNFAMIMAKPQRMAPRKIAEALLAHLDDPEGVLEKTEIAGPGFINFFIRSAAWLPVLRNIHAAGDRYGASDMGEGLPVQIEFVSANPTGPLHVGHGRGAAVGDTVARVLAFCGFDVRREYYINDSGRQIRTLGASVFARYRELAGQGVEFPEDGYRGDYIVDLAREIRSARGDALLEMAPEAALDECARYAAGRILAGIREDLADFGVVFENWFSEQSLYDAGKVAAAIDDLKARELVYEADGALWFRSTDYGDEKDRVVVRANGVTTYFASDIAYHKDKYDRGLRKVVDVWGADHHGYIPRMRAAVAACGRPPEAFDVILVQLVNLLRDGAPVAMSSRAGEFVTLKDVVDEVGADAARFIFLTRHYDSKLDFDLELAKRKTNDNPVYYVQYVHARIAGIIAKAAERGVSVPAEPKTDALERLDAPEEVGLIKTLARFPEIVAAAGRMMEPHRITYYLLELAAAFHGYYNKHKVLTEDDGLTAGRLCLVRAIRRVIANGLSLLGVSAPDTM